MRIAICDDDQISAGKIRKAIDELLEHLVPAQKQLVHISAYNNGSDLLDAHKKHKFDIVCLDVEMPGLSGLEVAETLRSLGSDALIIIVSSYPQYAKDGYKYDACAYVTKEELDRALPDALVKAMRKFDRQHHTPTYRISYMREEHRVPYNDIVSVNSRRRGSVVTTLEGVYMDRRQQEEAWAELQVDQRFLHINAYTIINADYISGFFGTEIQLSYRPDGAVTKEKITVAVGKNRMPEVKKLYFDYITIDL